jgi:8-oxo-dGTP pyrophosphatase MutT (NUDIX family)
MARVRQVSAGGLLWRPAPDGIEIAVIRHPQTRRWSLPKGRPRPRESLRAAALREVAEETGLRVRCGRPLGSVVTGVGGSLKGVMFWWMALRGGRFIPNAEADRLRWVTPKAAIKLLSSARDLGAVEMVTAGRLQKLPA